MKRLLVVLLFASCAATLPAPKSSAQWKEVARGCASGDPRACYWVAVSKLRAGDRAGAKQQYLALCADGFAAACNELGFLETKDAPADARAHWRRACELGDKDGCDSYGTGLRDGVGGAVDLPGAAAAYEKACGLKDSAGCTNLARLLATGKGVTANPSRAMALWAQVCASEEPWQACEELGSAHFEGALVPKDTERGLNILRRSCADAALRSCSATGHALHALGRNTEAVRYLRTSCDSTSQLGCKELLEVLTAIGDEAALAEAHQRSD